MSLSDLSSLPDKLLPSDENDPRAVRHYRLRTMLVACSAFLTVALIVLPAMFVGLPKLGQLAWSSDVRGALATEVEPLKKDIESVKKSVETATRENLRTRIWLLGNEVFKARQEQCNAIKAGSGARFWTERLMELKAEYAAIAGKEYDVPDCSEL